MSLGSMYNPPHPGEVLKGLYLEPMGLGITQTAKALGVSRVALSEIVNGRRGISPEMAIRLSRGFDTEAGMWLKLQMNYELWRIKDKKAEIMAEVSPLGQK